MALWGASPSAISLCETPGAGFMVHHENQVLGKENSCDGSGRGSAEFSAAVSGGS